MGGLVLHVQFRLTHAPWQLTAETLVTAIISRRKGEITMVSKGVPNNSILAFSTMFFLIRENIKNGFYWTLSDTAVISITYRQSGVFTIMNTVSSITVPTIGASSRQGTQTMTSTEHQKFPATNSEFFGCRDCKHRRKDFCYHDRFLPRPIPTWGWCPLQPDVDGPVQMWRGPRRQRGAR